MVISKNDRPEVSYFWKKSQTCRFVGILQPRPVMTFMRSRKSVRCGEVYSPTLKGVWLAMPLASILATLPLPLVPAT